MGIFTKTALWVTRGLGLTDPRLYNFVGGGSDSDAGERVTVEGAMQLDVVWACVRRIAETVATLPLYLYVNDTSGRASPASQHSLYSILHDRPNIEMTSVEFWEAMVGCYLLWGNAYASIDRAGSKIVALTPMRPDRVTVRRQTDGSLIYVYSWGADLREFAEGDIFHLKGFSLDGMMGLSPVGQARQILGSARAAERASGSFFRNGMRPSGFLKAPTYLTNDQRDNAKKLLENFKGAAQTGATPLLEGGWEWTALAIPPEEAQMLETRAFHVEQICRWFDIPPVLVGHSGQTTWGSGIEQIMLGWLTLGLRSHLKRIEQAIWLRLLNNREQSNYYAKFNVDALLRADSAGRAAQMASLAQNGLRTRNELRALDNEPPIPGGDIATVQSNLFPLDKIGSAEHIASPLAAQKPDAAAEKPSLAGANIPGK